MDFQIVGPISSIEIIAIGNSVHEIARLRKAYGTGRWRKLKGIALVLLPDGTICTAEGYWYEAHGI